MSKIEWTGQTWNPVVGCTIHSAGCKGCYAMKDAYRLMHNPNAKVAAKFAGTAKLVNGHAVWTGKLNLSEDALLAPLRRRTPTTYFVNSMSDLFHQQMPEEWIDRIFAVMALCPQHIFQVLTKRADRMHAYLIDSTWPRRVSEIVNAWPDSAISHGNEFAGDFALCFGNQLPNVWLGVSIEDRRTMLERAAYLARTPAAVRFWSAEPLIGDLGETALPVDWVICGGESGSTARPMHPDWARSLRDQCAAAGVPFFFKQWGEWAPTEARDDNEALSPAFRDARGSASCLVDGIRMGRIGKKLAGRRLDGVEHEEMPA